MKTRKIKLLYYKYREITIVVFCLCVLLVFGLKLLEIVIERSPYLSLVGVFFLLFFYFAAKKFKKVKL